MSKEISDIINKLRINIESIDCIDKGGKNVLGVEIAEKTADTIRRIELFLNEPTNKKEIIEKALGEISSEKSLEDLASL